MELNKAIKILKENRDVAKHRADGLEKNKLTDFLDIQYKIDKEDYEAIDTVLNELQILKKENDTLWEENIKLKQLNIAYKLRINDFAIDIHKAHAEGYQDGFKQAKFEVEMDKTQEESISKDKIIDKIKEIRDEYDERIKDNDSFYAYSNEYAHIEEVLRELLEEGNND